MEIQVSSKFPKFIDLYQGINEFTREHNIAQLLIEYQWMPSMCTHYNVFGHPLSQYLKQPRWDIIHTQTIKLNNTKESSKGKVSKGFHRKESNKGNRYCTK